MTSSYRALLRLRLEKGDEESHKFVPVRSGYNPPCKVCLRRESNPVHMVATAVQP